MPSRKTAQIEPFGGYSALLLISDSQCPMKTAVTGIESGILVPPNPPERSKTIGAVFQAAHNLIHKIAGRCR